MKDLNFNIYALVAPSTPVEYSALLDEALLELQYLNESLDRITEDCERGAKKGANND